MSHIFPAEALGRDFLSKGLGGISSARVPPSLLHNGPSSHANIASQVRLLYPLMFVCIFY